MPSQNSSVFLLRTKQDNGYEHEYLIYLLKNNKDVSEQV